MRKTEQLLRELVALPSVNPAFLPAGHEHAGEGRVGDFLAAKAVDAGLEVEFQDVLPGRSNLVVRLPPSGRIRSRILLAPHLDTVTAATLSQFTPIRKSGRLFGRGACDTKGSVAAMFTAVCRLARSARRPKETEIVFAGLVDEENAQAGSRALVRGGFKADLAIVGEPTRLRVVTAHKGSVWFRLETCGKSAHGARPELGRNAVHAMARIVEALETDYAEGLRGRRHALLGAATVNVGVIRGGTQPNIVPDRCVIEVDRRTLPGETDSGVRREVAGFLKARGLQAGFESSKDAPCRPLETAPGLALVRQFLACAGQRNPSGVDFFCDAAVLAGGGMPSVVFGPGDIAQAHTAQEWIDLEQLDRAADLLEVFLQSLP